MRSKEDENRILSKRALVAREAAGFSRKKAASFLGFNNYQILSAIEKGKRNINAHELSAMARLYGRSLSYFFESEISPDPIPLWRKSTKADIKTIQRQFLAFLENYCNMENLLDLTRRWKDIQKSLEKDDFSARGFKLARQLGTDIWSHLDLGSRPTFNLLNVLENDLRIKVLHLPLQNGVSGACVVDDTLGVGILVNRNDAPWRRNYDLAHELFHVVTWEVFTHEEVGDGTERTKPEQYADAFASSLLLPERHLRKAVEEVMIGGRLRIVDVIELAKDFGVSTEAVLWRLVNMGAVKKSKVKNILGESDFRETDRQQRKGLYGNNIPTKFPSRYISLACRCLMEGKISRGTFAKYLEIDRAEVDDFLIEAGFLEKTYEKIASA